MKIKINGSYLPKEANEDQTVGQVYEQLKQEIYSGKKVIANTFVDGIALNRNWKDRDKLNLSVKNATELELIIDEPANLSKNMLKDCEELSNTLIKKTSNLAYKFRVGEEADANNEFAEFLEGLNLVVNTVDQTIRKNAGMTAEIRSKAKTSGDALIPVLDRIYKAQASGDYITIADEIEYNMPTVMADWSSIIEEAKTHLRTTSKLQ